MFKRAVPPKPETFIDIYGREKCVDPDAELSRLVSQIKAQGGKSAEEVKAGEKQRQEALHQAREAAQHLDNAESVQDFMAKHFCAFVESKRF